MPRTVHRVAPQVLQHVVHPAEVPLEVELEAAALGRGGHSRPRGRLLGDDDRTRRRMVDLTRQLAHEGDGLEVLTATVDVGNPLAVVAGVVAIEHRRHGIHAKPVDVVLLDPPARR